MVFWNLFSSTSKELQNELNRRAWFDTIPRFALRPAANDEARYKDFQDFLYSSGLIEKKVSIKELTRDITRK